VTDKAKIAIWLLVATSSATVLLMMALPVGVRQMTEDFSGYPAGTVVAGDEPGGGVASGTLFSGFTLSVTNNGGGPHSLVIFDSAAPTGDDPDLGSPNETFGGPGIGQGGQAGQPGVNEDALGNLLVIAEDIEDVDPEDGLVDDPDDEAGGGLVHFDFDEPVLIDAILLVDIDERSRAGITLFRGSEVAGTTAAGQLGDNSCEAISLAGFGVATRLEIDLIGSGGIGWIRFGTPPTAADQLSWGRIKALFQSPAPSER